MSAEEERRKKYRKYMEYSSLQKLDRETTALAKKFLAGYTAAQEDFAHEAEREGNIKEYDEIIRVCFTPGLTTIKNMLVCLVAEAAFSLRYTDKEVNTFLKNILEGVTKDILEGVPQEIEVLKSIEEGLDDGTETGEGPETTTH